MSGNVYCTSSDNGNDNDIVVYDAKTNSAHYDNFMTLEIRAGCFWRKRTVNTGWALNRMHLCSYFVCYVFVSLDSFNYSYTNIAYELLSQVIHRDEMTIAFRIIVIRSIDTDSLSFCQSFYWVHEITKNRSDTSPKSSKQNALKKFNQQSAEQRIGGDEIGWEVSKWIRFRENAFYLVDI